MKWRKANVEKLAKDAEAALNRGACLKAGSLIDQGYYSLGRAEAAGWRAVASRRRLRDVDEKFEKVCVRRHPK